MVISQLIFQLPAFYLFETVLEMLLMTILRPCSLEEGLSALCKITQSSVLDGSLCARPSAKHYPTLVHADCTTVTCSRSLLYNSSLCSSYPFINGLGDGRHLHIKSMYQS